MLISVCVIDIALCLLLRYIEFVPQLFLAKTIKQLSEMANKLSDKKNIADGISQKLNKGTMKYDEVQFLAGLLGYEIEFKKVK